MEQAVWADQPTTYQVVFGFLSCHLVISALDCMQFYIRNFNVHLHLYCRIHDFVLQNGLLPQRVLYLLLACMCR